jgi:hypothetical protein
MDSTCAAVSIGQSLYGVYRGDGLPLDEVYRGDGLPLDGIYGEDELSWMESRLNQVLL